MVRRGRRASRVEGEEGILPLRELAREGARGPMRNIFEYVGVWLAFFATVGGFSKLNILLGEGSSEVELVSVG